MAIDPLLEQEKTWNACNSDTNLTISRDSFTNQIRPIPVPKSLYERDPLGKNQKELGAKMDYRKPPVLRGCIQYFPRALAEVAHVSEIGARKYTWKGWETVPDGINRYGDALVRHLLAEEHGPVDEDTGLLHAAQEAWNALARLELILRSLEIKGHTKYT